MILTTLVSAWLIYEIIDGCLVIKGEHFSYNKKRPHVFPSILFSKDYTRYREWREWKGERFK